MKISYNWLRQYLQADLTPEVLSRILTSIGLEVDAVETRESVRGGLAGLVVGKVLTCTPHPNSDHLHITLVDIGAEAPLQIVCGAPNVAAGQKVIIATIGTRLYKDDESFVIKRSKLRGVDSYGMICAEDEIGIGTNHDGILILPDDPPVGMAAKDYFHITHDTIIDIDITPNRADAISHYGVARDVAAYCAAHDIPAQLQHPDVDTFKTDNTQLPITVEIADSTRCPRYSGVSISGIKIAPSPAWMQECLNAIGIRPINNVVDATNYALHAFGQPLHAFDADKIVGNRIIVRTVPEGTPFITLDGVERTLSAQDLMICNTKEPMCMAGVFGGLNSGITDDTVNIFLESAYFNPVSIRKTARRHGISTDASFRFERGIDPHGTIYVLKYTAMLIKKIAGGCITSDVVDINPAPIADFTVDLSLAKMNALNGIEIPAIKAETIFRALEMQVLSHNGDHYTLQVPAYRVDVQRDVDVAEDVLRIYGYDNVPVQTSLKSNISYTVHPDNYKLQNRIADQLTAQGFNEIINNSLTKRAYYEALQTYPIASSVQIMNALSNDLSVMRQTLLFGGLESLIRNINRQNSDLKFYEFGNCYRFRPEERSDNPLSAYTETMHLGLWLTGNNRTQSWLRSDEPTSFYDLKAYVQNIFHRLGIAADNVQTSDYNNELLQNGLLLSLNKRAVAVLGIVAQPVLRRFDINQPVYYADLTWQPLIDASAKRQILYHDIPRFPEVKRDLSMLVDGTVSFADIERVARTTERNLLTRINLFDVYENKLLEVGKKSYAVSFYLQDREKTLTDKQIDSIMQRLIDAFAKQLGATLR